MPRISPDRPSEPQSTFAIELDGESITAVDGESILSAVAASGKLLLRTDKRGAMRAPFCGMGVCFDCQVSVNNQPPQRACLTKVQPGMFIRTQAYRAKMPQRESADTPKAVVERRCDALVVGSGPAGMAMAIKLASANVNTIVVDERPDPGGQFYKQNIVSRAHGHPQQPDSQFRDGAALISSFLNSGVEVIYGATVWAAFHESHECIEICASTNDESLTIIARQLVLANGAYESAPAFPGWTLPGTMSTGAVQSLVRAYSVSPGRRVLIAGNGPLNLQLACELTQRNIEVVAIAESAAQFFPRRWQSSVGAILSSPALTLRGLSYLNSLRKRAVKIYHGHHIMRAEGDAHVRSGSIAAIDESGRFIAGTEMQFDVDLICIGYRLCPSSELAQLLGCKFSADANGEIAPVRNAVFQTTLAGVFVIGDGAVLGGAHVAMAEAAIAAAGVIANLSQSDASPRICDRLSLRRHRFFQRRLWSMYRSPVARPALPETPICRCEMVTLGEIESLLESGVADLGSLKRLSRAGMGVCQGRYCKTNIAEIVSRYTGESKSSIGSFASQVPVKPVLIDDVAIAQPEWRGYRAVRMPNPVNSPKVGETNFDADVVVIGAGIVGISTALFLAREGTDVIIVDRGVANGQASGSNAGSLHLQLLSFDFDPGISETGTPAVHALGLQKSGIDTWIRLQSELQADFEIDLCGGLMLAETMQDLENLDKKAELERGCGIDVEILSAHELQNLAPEVSGDKAGAAFCAGEGKINPLVATPALLAAAVNAGARILEHCAVLDIINQRASYRVATSQGTINCGQVVNAAGGWSAEIAAMLDVALPVQMAPQQMIVTEPVEDTIHHLLALAGRHLTMKQVANGNIIVGGGWPAKFDRANRRPVALRASLQGNLFVAKRVLTGIGQLHMIRSWATMGVMIDGAPILGELPGQRGFYNAVGANGYTMGPALGQLTAELVSSGRAAIDLQPFSVDRFG